MPSLYSEAMGGLVVGVDTSGSIGPHELDQIAGEITAIAQDCNPDWVEVVYCDTCVGHTERFEQGEPIKLHPKGGGGTRFKPVFDYTNSINDRIAALIYFTDLEGNVDECEEPEYPVIWAVTSRRKMEVPFGTSVKVTV
jgi:predicted metal-dependent peptidase